jgi:RNA polymerase sigma factor (sigma-70 family)
MNQVPVPSDEALAHRLAQGDEGALDELMDRWQEGLRGFLYRIVGNHADALDLAQETFVRLHRHRFRYREGARFSTWMFQIALNLGRDHLRRSRRRPNCSLDEAPEAVDPQHPGLGPLLEERARAVREAVQALPDDLREAVVLSEFEDLSHDEIAKAVGCTPKAVETRLYRARQRLRESLGAWLKAT